MSRVFRVSEEPAWLAKPAGAYGEKQFSGQGGTSFASTFLQAKELAGLTKAANLPAAARLARMEKHMREHKLRAATLTERLARVDDGVSKSTHALISLYLHGSVCSVRVKSRPVCTRG